MKISYNQCYTKPLVCYLTNFHKYDCPHINHVTPTHVTYVMYLSTFPSSALTFEVVPGCEAGLLPPFEIDAGGHSDGEKPGSHAFTIGLSCQAAQKSIEGCALEA